MSIHEEAVQKVRLTHARVSQTRLRDERAGKKRISAGQATPASLFRMTIRTTFAQACRGTRIRLEITQQELADSVGVTRGYIANVEAARANPSFRQVERISDALGIDLLLTADPPTFLSERLPHDLVHSRCSVYTARRLEGLGW